MRTIIKRLLSIGFVTMLMTAGFPIASAGATTTNPLQYIEGVCTGSNSQRNVTIKNVGSVNGFVHISATSTGTYTPLVFLAANQSYSFTATSGSTLHVYKTSAPVLQQSDWTVTAGCDTTPYTAPQAATTVGSYWGTDQATITNNSGILTNYTWTYGGCETNYYGGLTGYALVRLANTSSTRLFFEDKNLSIPYNPNPSGTLTRHSDIDGLELAPSGAAAHDDALTYTVPTGGTLHLNQLNGARQQLDLTMPASANCATTTSLSGNVTSTNAVLPAASTQTLSVTGITACDAYGTRNFTVNNNDTTGAFVQSDDGSEMTTTSTDDDTPNYTEFVYLAPGQHVTLQDLHYTDSTALHLRRYNASTDVLDAYIATCP